MKYQLRSHTIRLIGLFFAFLPYISRGETNEVNCKHEAVVKSVRAAIKQALKKNGYGQRLKSIGIPKETHFQAAPEKRDCLVQFVSQEQSSGGTTTLMSGSVRYHISFQDDAKTKLVLTTEVE